MSRPLDPAFKKLLEDPRVELRRPPPDVSVEQIRAAANAFLVRAPRPSIHEAIDLQAETRVGALEMRLYKPSHARNLPLVAFMHGGAFVFGDLESHDAMARKLASGANAAVAAVHYRLAPEHPFPAALEDCAAALDWLVASGEDLGIDSTRVALAGDSAGGQLAVATAIQCRQKQIVLRHLGLLYPLLDPSQQSASARSFASGYMLSGSFLDWAWEVYSGTSRRENPLLDVTRASVDGLPPTTIVTAEYDPLRDEGEAFGERLRLAGIDVEVTRFQGMIHGFAGLPQFTPFADEAIGLLARRLGAALQP